MKKRSDTYRFVLLFHCLTLLLPILFILWGAGSEGPSVFHLFSTLTLVNLIVFELIAISLIRKLRILKPARHFHPYMHGTAPREGEEYNRYFPHSCGSFARLSDFTDSQRVTERR